MTSPPANRDNSPRPFYLAGQWTTSADTREIRSPWDNSIAGTVCLAGKDQLEKASAAAVAVQQELAAAPRHLRASWCQSVSDAIARMADAFSESITAESGKPIQYAKAETRRAVTTFALAAQETVRMAGEQIPLDLSPATEDAWGFTIRVPRGPVAAIAPFNYPLNLVAHKIAPAIATGCPVVLKPPPQAPLTALLLAEVIDQVGLPAGSVSILPMGNDVAESMVRDDRFSLLSFTGSAKVGWRLKSVCGRKPALLELGGNAPAIVLNDADLDLAVQKLVPAAFAAAGQVCIKAQRLLVHESLFDQFLERYLAATDTVKTGDPWQPDTVTGPLIDSGAADRVEAWVREAVDQGAVSHREFHRDGNVISPLILTETTNAMKVECEEIFGPVVLIRRIRDLDDAIAAANDSPYGLQAGVFTNSLSHARRAIAGLTFGGVIINDSPMLRVDNFPYGGTKQSGLGREGVRYSMEEYTEPRMVVMRFPG